MWKLTDHFDVPRDKVIRGMQANIFTVILSTSDRKSSVSLVCKRVVPKELPDKANVQMWKSFVHSVQREVEFYRHLMREGDQMQSLFPRCYFSEGKEVV